MAQIGIMLHVSELGIWHLDDRPLDDGDLVELFHPEWGAWVPGVIVCDGTAVEPQGTDAQSTNHAADPEQNLTLEWIADHGCGLRRVPATAGSRSEPH